MLYFMSTKCLNFQKSGKNGHFFIKNNNFFKKTIEKIFICGIILIIIYGGLIL